MNSALSILRTFSCALDTFLEKTSCLFLPHLSNLAVRNEFTELLFSTCSRYYWNYCHFIVFSFMFSTRSVSQYCKRLLVETFGKLSIYFTLNINSD